ncbi:MAG: right-handed parallel beta-helix repeat-containing protein [Promethearchaeota archaeon]
MAKDIRNLKRCLLLLMLSCLLFIFYFGVFFWNINYINIKNLDENNAELERNHNLFNIIASEVHGSIKINSDIELDAFCNGNGTNGSINNPHIIQNYEINTAGNGIEISNTTKYLIIRNCTIISSGGSGILLNKSNNIKVENCSIEANRAIYLNWTNNINITESKLLRNIINGIKAENSSNINIYNNTFSENNGTSAYFESCKQINFSLNIMFNNSPQSLPYSEVYIMNISDSEFSNNIITQNQGNGTYIGDLVSEINFMFNNILNNKGSGIYQNGSSECFNITLKYNHISNNSQYGIYWINGSLVSDIFILYNNIDNNSLTGINVYSDNISISGNNATHNGKNGIELKGFNITCFGNNASFNKEIGIYIDSNNTAKIWLNYISNNSYSEGFDVNGLVLWDNGTLGNYWGDYINLYPSANSNNGIVWNQPYLVNQTSGNDNFPLVNADISPSLNNPSDVHYETNTIGHWINWTINDWGYYNSSYYIYQNQTMISNGTWNNGSEVSINVDGLSPSIIYLYKIVVHDGTAWGFSEDEVIVTVNTFPIALSVHIEPSNAYTNDSLIASYTYYDEDGDPEGSTRIRWYKNNVYQPQFDDLTIIPAIWTNKSEVWNFTVQPNDGKDYGNIYWSSSLTIQNSIPNVTSVSLGADTRLTTENISVSYIFNDLDGDIDQSRIIWYEGGIEQPQFENLTEISAIWTNKSDVWYVGIYPYDGEDFGDMILSNFVQIVNSIPQITIVSFTPSNPKTTDILNISYIFSDADNDSDQSIIRWYKNGVHYTQNDNNTILSSSETFFGDQWHVEITPYDGESYGIMQSSIVLQIENTPPRIENISLTQNPYTIDDIICSYNYIDDDGHVEIGTLIRWYKNGQPYVLLDGELRVPNNFTHEGDRWRVTIRPYDGYDFGLLYTSSEVEVLTNYNPLFELAPNDTEIIVGAKDATLKWKLQDDNIRNASYILKINGLIVMEETNWESGDEIILNLENFKVGRYKIELIVLDGLGGETNDVVYLNVMPSADLNNSINIMIAFTLILMSIGIIWIFIDRRELNRRLNEIIEMRTLRKKEQQIKEIIDASEEHFKNLKDA